MSDEPEPQVFTDLEAALISKIGSIHGDILPPLQSAIADLDPSLTVSPEFRQKAFEGALAAVNSLDEATKP